MNDLFLILAVVIAIALDLAAAAARTGFSGSSYARLLALRDEAGKPLTPTINLFQARRRTK